MNQKKNILVFCDTFLPPAYKPRVRYFCSYFQKNDYNLTMITEYNNEQNLLPDSFPVYSIDYYRFRGSFLYRFEWVLKIILNLFFPHKSIFFYRKARKLLKNKHFDVVFCSTDFHPSPLITAAMMAKKLHVLPLFVDLRDIFEQSPDSSSFIAKKPDNFLVKSIIELYRKINIKRRNKVLKQAAGISSVSDWHVQFLKKFNPNTHLIHNGFDETLFIQQNRNLDNFFISYFGDVFSEQSQDPNILFAAIRNLEKCKKITPEKFYIKWFVGENSKQIIQKIAKKHNVEKFMSFEKQVLNEQYVTELSKSSILLILCSSVGAKKHSGIMTTKFFEYVGVNRPILCTPNNNDELAETINAIGCGLVSSDVVEIENFILERYAEWQETGFTKGTVSSENRIKFSRRNGAEILEKLLSNLA